MLLMLVTIHIVVLILSLKVTSRGGFTVLMLSQSLTIIHNTLINIKTSDVYPTMQ